MGPARRREPHRPGFYRFFHGAAFDPDERRMYVFGGGADDEVNQRSYNDLWALDVEGGVWTRLSAPAQLWSRTRSTLVHDRARARLLLFGGRVHQRISVDIPKRRLTVFTGVAGSGSRRWSSASSRPSRSIGSSNAFSFNVSWCAGPAR